VTRQALLNQLAVLLGGRSAEIVFQEISTGAQNDLQRATDLARAMVAECGMSALGPSPSRGALGSSSSKCQAWNRSHSPRTRAAD
jgi:ATP-dependent Zn protease